MTRYWLARLTDDKFFKVAIENNFWVMQQQYGKQESPTVTILLNNVKKVKIGDFLILDYGSKIHAIGKVCYPKKLSGDVKISSLRSTIKNNKHDYFDGFVKYEDSDVYYENFTDFNGEWGQRIDVEKWDNYFKNGIPNSGLKEAIIKGIVQHTIFEVKEEYFLKKQKELFTKYLEIMSLTDKIKNLLEFKKQIILQGPPGTGKTRQAKLIAVELTKPRTVGNPESIIDDLVKNFNPNDETIKTLRESKDKILSTFYELFPKENLYKLTLQSYCAGKGDRDNFCWWIETGLKSLGSYSPGSARSYLIFWKKAIDEYSKHGFVKDIDDNNEAMKKIAELIFELVQNKDTENAVQYFGDSFLLKILNSYYPDEYFPINSERMIENALKIFKISFQGLNVFEKNQKLNQVYNDKKKQLNSEITNNEFGKLLWENFNLKTGEDIGGNNEAIAKGEFEIIQFHPAYSYEDFVRGIVAETTESGNVSYQVENKILADFAQNATDNPNGNYVLIIDEINRANLPAVLGELIYALEYRNEQVTSMYEYEGEREITLPKNLYIIGTMNTADRSVGHIDYAIRRRFAFVDILPDENVIKNATAKTLYNEIKTLFGKDFLSPDFKAKDVMIGHSYFLVKDEDELRIRLEFEIKPILREYWKDGIFLETANEKIESLNV